MNKKTISVLFVLLLVGSVSLSAAPSFKAVFEQGFLAVLDHKIQFSKDGTYLDYVDQGGQDNLFAVSRLSLEIGLDPNNKLIFLYQPLDIQTRDLLRSTVRIDSMDFTNGTAVNFRYGFPFYRLSYLYDFDKSKDREFAIGFSMQIRNATIEFESVDGTQFRENHNIGPVPLIKFRWRAPTGGGWWMGIEIDGFYAPIAYLNGSDSDVIGAILDASYRVGIQLDKDKEAFLNLRYLGGGAEGTSSSSDPPGDGFTKNWLHFLTVSLGFSVTLQ